MKDCTLPDPYAKDAADVLCDKSWLDPWFAEAGKK